MKLNLLDNIKGGWKYQKTIYDLNKKTINNYKQCIDISMIDTNPILTLNQKILVNHEVYSTMKLNNNILNKDYSFHNILYNINSKSINQLNVTYKIKNIKFQEKIYTINSNFFIVIGIIKKCNKYLGISFTSFIKIV